MPCQPKSTPAPKPGRFDLLLEKFPSTFNAHKPKPLKLGILQDLFEELEPESRTPVRRLLGAYCHTRRYLKALVSQDVRVNLQGNPCGAVTAEQKERAKKELLVARKQKGKAVINNQRQQSPANKK